MVTVEFIDLKIAPEPIRAVSFFSRTISVASMIALETLSFPYIMPTSCSSKKASSICAFFNASIVAI
ncbi:hypothetical protein D3C80_1706340 [compost metagenome]